MCVCVCACVCVCVRVSELWRVLGKGVGGSWKVLRKSWGMRDGWWCYERECSIWLILEVRYDLGRQTCRIEFWQMLEPCCVFLFLNFLCIYISFSIKYMWLQFNSDDIYMWYICGSTSIAPWQLLLDNCSPTIAPLTIAPLTIAPMTIAPLTIAPTIIVIKVGLNVACGETFKMMWHWVTLTLSQGHSIYW